MSKEDKKIDKQCQHKYKAIKTQNKIYKNLIAWNGAYAIVLDEIEKINLYCVHCGKIINN